MISWHRKLLIGGIGALCLSLLKLISAGFYLGNAGQAALGAYLTYGAYLVLGMAVGYFFCEDNSDANKTRKSAFLMGLLAPSILIAIVAKPLSDQPAQTGTQATIPTLSFGLSNFLHTTVYAQTNGQALKKPTGSSVQQLSAKDVTPTLSDGIRSALGTGQISTQYFYVLGKTSSSDVAAKNADQINAWLRKADPKGAAQVQIVTPDSGKNLYLTLGGASSASVVEKTREGARQAGSLALSSSATDQDRAAAKALLNGQIVKGGSLFQ